MSEKKRFDIFNYLSDENINQAFVDLLIASGLFSLIAICLSMIAIYLKDILGLI